MNRKSVMIYAYTRFNLGDDLFVKMLCDRYPEVEFHLYTYPEYKQVLKECTNLIIHSNGSFVSKFLNLFGRLSNQPNYYERHIAKKRDACVCITGSLFIQADSNWKPYFEYMKSRKINNKPFFLISSNFGPYSDPEYFESFKTLFAEYDDICFREKYTYELFRDLPNTRDAPDVLLLTDKKRIRKTTEKYIAISVIDVASRPDLKPCAEAYENCIVEIIKNYIENGYQIKLLSFCKMENDHLFAERILESNSIFHGQVEHCCYNDGYGLTEMVDLIANAHVVIATRFHAMILGWVFQKKTLPIIYSSKMKHVMDDFKYDKPYLEIKTLVNDVNSEALLQVLENLEVFNISEYVSMADKQFEKLDYFLGEYLGKGEK